MRFHHLALRVFDPEASFRFYGELLGLSELWRVEERGELRALWLRAGDAVLMLERELRGAGPATGSAHVLAFAVPDLREWERKMEAAGVPVDDRTPYTIFVRDPDGHRVALSVYRFVDESSGTFPVPISRPTAAPSSASPKSEPERTT